MMTLFIAGWLVAIMLGAATWLLAEFGGSALARRGLAGGWSRTHASRRAVGATAFGFVFSASFVAIYTLGGVMMGMRISADDSKWPFKGRLVPSNARNGCNPGHQRLALRFVASFAGVAYFFVLVLGVPCVDVWGVLGRVADVGRRVRSARARRVLRRQVADLMEAWEQERQAKGVPLDYRSSPACTLCGTELAAAMNTPCGHALLCVGCATLFREENGDICHACRQPSQLVEAVTRDRQSAASLRRARRPWRAREAWADRVDVVDNVDNDRPQIADLDEGERLFEELRRASSKEFQGFDSTRLRDAKRQVAAGRSSDRAALLRATCAACAKETTLVVDVPCGHASLCRGCAATHRDRAGDVCSRCGDASTLADPVRDVGAARRSFDATSTRVFSKQLSKEKHPRFAFAPKDDRSF